MLLRAVTRRGLAVKAQGAAAQQATKEKARAALEKQKAEWSSPYVEMKSRRTGVIALKAGMITLYDAMGRILPCTVLKLEDVVVIQQRTLEKNGYTALQLGAGPAKTKSLAPAQIGEFAKFGVDLKAHIEEFKVSTDCLLPEGTRIDVRHFVPGQEVDVQGVTIGKGFQGGMKRWGFSGFPGSHGTSASHRALGATGCRQDPGKIWPGKKMAGRMGNRRRTVQNLRLIAVDPIRELLFVHGQVPGKAGNYVRVADAVKLPSQFRDRGLPLPFPTFSGPKASADTTGPETWLFDRTFVSMDKPAEAKFINPQKASAKSSK